jgi:hypothetical protein
MITIFLPRKQDPGKDQASSEEIQKSINTQQQQINITDGGEFLDDGIRMKDQPFCESNVKENE